jgi:hypothetical protein
MRWFPFLLALGCAPATPSGSAPPPVVLRTWELPPGYAPRLVGSLQRVLDEQGRAQEGPGGSLMVVAPAKVLDGVDVVVRSALDAPAAPPPRNVEVEYWLVRGVPAAEASRGAGLDALGAVLDTIQMTDGPLALTLAGTRRLRTLDGDRGTLEDDALKISQTVGIEPGARTIVADVGVRVPYGMSESTARFTGSVYLQTEVQTRLSVASGAVAVLSQAGFPSEEGPSSLYLLVRPTIVE